MAVDEMVVKWSMDSSNFNSGLTKLNKSMSVLQSEFKATSSGLSNFGSETDKLKNKADFLNKSMELQKAKVDTLSKAYEKAKTETGENSTQTQNLAIKLNNAIGYYNKLEGELKTTNSELETQSSKWNKISKSLENVSEKMSAFGTKMTSFGKNLTVGVTAPIIAIGAKSFELASDMNESLNKVDVAFGSNADEVKNWSDTTLDSFGIAKGSALDMASLFGDMGTGMGLTTEESAKMSESLVGLAGDLSSFKNVKLDVAKTALNGIFTGETESLKGLGIVMTQANLEAYALEKGMLKADENSPKIIQANINVQKATENLAEAIKKHGSNSLEAQEAQAKLGLAQEKLEKSSTGALDSLTQQQQVQLRYAFVVDKSKNAVGDFARTQDSAANQQRKATEGLKELGAEFGQQLVPTLTMVLAKVNDLLKQFNGLDQGTQKNIIKMGLFAAALGPVTTVLGTMLKIGSGTVKFVTNLGTNLNKVKDAATGAGKALKTIGTTMLNGAKAAGTFALNIGKGVIQLGKMAIQAAISTVKLIAHKVATIAASIASKAMAIAQAALNFVMALNPITLIIIGIVALVAVIVILWNKCEWFRNGVTGVFEWIGNLFSKFSSFLTGIFATDWTNSFGVFGNILNAFFANISNIFEGVKRIFGGIIDFVTGVFTGNWSQAWQGVMDIFGGIFDTLGGILKAPLNGVIGLINMAIDGLNSISVDIPDWVPGIGGTTFGVELPKMDYLYNGGIIDRPTNIGGNTIVGDSYKGLGRQAEAVIPLDSMYRNLRNIVKEESSSQPVILYTTNITTLDGKEIARETKKEIIKDITKEQKSRNRGLGYA